MRIDINYNYLEDIKSSIADELTNVAQRVEEKSKRECPVDTGALREDISFEVDRNLLEAKIGNSLDYSIYVLLGTVRKLPDNYLVRGLDI